MEPEFMCRRLLLFVLLLEFACFGNAAYKEDPCEEDADPGPCQQYQIKWFWDSVDEMCKEFHYGGCMGTRNRFNTKAACVKACRYKLFNPVAVPDLCLLPPDNGHCGDERTGQWWFFFNSDSGMCEKLFYYGCGGNDNKFYSLHLCRRVCAERLSPQIACDSCDIRTSICKAHSKMNYTCECRLGYEKSAMAGECVDIDECRGGRATCDSHAWCTNTLGSYSCECMAGYRGDGKTCTYVGLGRSTMDCASCSPDATCESGVCICKKGFQGDGFNCTDVNECLRAPYVCDRHAECVNRDGSFICACLAGYAGNGYNCTKTACLDKFDRVYQDTCGGENWREHFYYDHASKSCALFWYDGCRSRSQNIFSEFSTCQSMCEETNVLNRAEICWDQFDLNYRNQCSNGRWEQRFYFDHASLTCRQFWYDGCRSDSRNMFEDSLTCQWLCESQPMYKSRSCLEDFDHHYKDMCNGGRWRQQFFFDRNTKRCVAFWYDGCTGASQNIFQDEQSCLKTCEDPAKRDRGRPAPRPPQTISNRSGVHFRPPPAPELVTWRPRPTGPATLPHHQHRHSPQPPPPLSYVNHQNAPPLTRHSTHHEAHHEAHQKGHHRTSAPHAPPQPARTISTFDPSSFLAVQPWHSNDRALMKEKLGDVFKPNLTDVCEVANPCRNNATCIFAWKKNTYYCKCRPGWTGTHCTEVADFDPCSTSPCKNGATCKAKTEAGRTTHECFCPSGFGGKGCTERPCDSAPCHNNGTCRTTAASSAFFCDCPEQFGGKQCEFEINTFPTETYGKNVEQVSSGKKEWVDELKKHMQGKVKKQQQESAASSASKESASSPSAKKADTMADEQYKDPATKKRERAEAERRRNAEYSRIEAVEVEQREKEKEDAVMEAKKRAAAEEEEAARKNSADGKTPLPAIRSLSSLIIAAGTLLIF